MADEFPTRRHTTPEGADYTKFSIHCQHCDDMLMEFVHKQVYVGTLSEPSRHFRDPSSAFYIKPEYRPESGYAQAQSWYKPQFRIQCYEMTDGTREHLMSPVKAGQDRNQYIRSVSLTHQQFLDWTAKEPNL